MIHRSPALLSLPCHYCSVATKLKFGSGYWVKVHNCAEMRSYVCSTCYDTHESEFEIGAGLKQIFQKLMQPTDGTKETLAAFIASPDPGSIASTPTAKKPEGS